MGGWASSGGVSTGLTAPFCGQEKLQARTGIASAAQILHFGQSRLDPNRALEEYGLTSEDQLRLEEHPDLMTARIARKIRIDSS